MLKVKLLSPNAKVPKRATPGSGAYDVFTPRKITVCEGKDVLVDTQIQIEFPVGYVCQVWPKSGLEVKYRLTTAAGLIDSDYRGSLFILLRRELNENALSHELKSYAPGSIVFNEGDKIAQISFVKCLTDDFVEVDTLSETERGARGFGSTGK